MEPALRKGQANTRGHNHYQEITFQLLIYSQFLINHWQSFHISWSAELKSFSPLCSGYPSQQLPFAQESLPLRNGLQLTQSGDQAARNK